MKHILLLLIILCMSFGSQPAGHEWFGDNVIKQGSSQLNLGIMNAPVYGIASHMALDRIAGEAGLDFQLDIALVRTIIMYVNTPDNHKSDFLVNSFWSLFPDIWDKGLNRKDFHPAWIEPPIIPLSAGATDLLEELAVLSYTVKF